MKEDKSVCDSSFCLALPQKMEGFSRAFVHAVASVAGYGVEPTTIDFDSIDLKIMQYGSGNNYPEQESLSVQLKSTYAHKPNNGYLSYPLPIKNYDDLRRKTLSPRILVVVHIPRNTRSWLKQTNKYIALHYCGYWISLLNAPPSQNRTHVTVKLPIVQKFTVEELRRIMSLIARGAKP